jgi:hypothetical protein
MTYDHSVIVFWMLVDVVTGITVLEIWHDDERSVVKDIRTKKLRQTIPYGRASHCTFLQSHGGCWDAKEPPKSERHLS